MTKPSDAPVVALAVLQAISLFALFTQTEPHPPAVVAPFAIGPFLAASLAACAAASLAEDRRARIVSLSFVAALALVSFGPQKYVDPKIGQIWPAVVAGQVAIAFIVLQCVKLYREGASRPDQANVAQEGS